MQNPLSTPVVYTFESTEARQRRLAAQATERAKIAALLRAGKLPFEISAILGWDAEDAQEQEAGNG